MSVAVWIDAHSPSVNTMVHKEAGCECIFLTTTFEGDDKVNLRFENKNDMVAYVNLLMFAAGMIKESELMK